MKDTGSAEYLRGWVFSEKPVLSATLVVYDTEGKVIKQDQESATSDSGTFLLEVSNCPSNFRIVSTEGTMDGNVFTTELNADYRDFNPETDIAYVNMVTTLISAYIDKHPDKTLDEVKQVIKNYLEIPEAVNLDSGLSIIQQYFNHEKFMEEAARNGGASKFIDSLIAEADSGKTHPFAGVVFDAEAGDLVTDFIGCLDEEMLSQLEEQGTGWLLDALGFGSNTQLVSVLETMTGILGKLEEQLGAIYQRLSTQINQTNYNAMLGQLTPLIDKTKTTFRDLVFAASYKPVADKDKAWLAQEKERIKTIIGTEILPFESVFYDQLVGTGYTDGLIKIWSNIVKSQRQFLAAANYPDIKAQFDYFDVVQVLQRELIVEYYHATEAPAEELQQSWDIYNGNRETQLKMLAQPVPDDNYYDSKTGLLICNHISVFEVNPGTIHYCLDYLEDLNNNRSGGFSGWRLPTSGELETMFSSRGTMELEDYLDQQGLPLLSVESLGILRDFAEGILTRVQFQALYHQVVFYSIREFKEIEVEYELMWSGKDYFLFQMAVRTPASGELYFW